MSEYLTIEEALAHIRLKQPDALPASITWDHATKKVVITTCVELTQATKDVINGRRQTGIAISFEVSK